MSVFEGNLLENKILKTNSNNRKIQLLFLKR